MDKLPVISHIPHIGHFPTISHKCYLKKLCYPGDLCHIGDIFALPFFLLLINYFYNIQNKTFLENFLFLFIIIACLIDTYFSYCYIIGLKKKNKKKK